MCVEKKLKTIFLVIENNETRSFHEYEFVFCNDDNGKIIYIYTVVFMKLYFIASEVIYT